ncbi:acyltransferase [Mesorhizobium sp. LNHC209A00]|uniref:acyltransferase family protein n=1 Tax=Mesorhizobium TaxID=68287 RepID=UPI0003CFA486|nr:acyltransferase [Mesorhizobium sp. LNHC209A00]ESY92708.1 hypothetical protein X738_26790 [Mesorhizobium sp. LNHC209A00]
MEKDWIEALDGLRGVAAYSVVISHYAGQTILQPLHLVGQVGVMLFFVISGFLMGDLYMRTPFTRGNLQAFYIKRFARVVPLYYLVVLASVTLFMARQSVWPAYSIDALWHYLLFWRGENVLWTIPVEVQFYALFPVIWWLFSRAGPASMLLILVFCAIEAAWIDTPVLFQSFLPYFAAGLLLSIVQIPYSRLIEFMILPAAIVLTLALPDISAAMGFRPTGLWESPVYLLTVPTTVLLVIKSRGANVLLGGRIGVFAGKISYSVYLLHMPVHFVMRQLPIYETSPLLFIGLTLIVTTAVSWLSFTIIEKPARNWINGTFASGESGSARAVLA